MSTPCLQTLPVELLHRIVDIIDTKTVFLSFRYVCKRFYIIINTHNQYRLDFRLISKPDFNQLCRLIRSENVIGLTLSNDNETVGQIELFLNHFDINTFTRLRSLTLIRINESDLKLFLNSFIIHQLVSLSIDYQHEKNSIIEITEFLSLTIEKLNNLRRFDCKVDEAVTRNIRWPKQCSTKYLTLKSCTSIQVLTILRDLQDLQILISNSN